MKQKIAVLAMVLGIMINRGVSAQGYPVIDITAIIAAIENGFTMAQQLQTMYETFKTSYDQLQKQIKSFESFNFNELDMRDPLGSWRSLTTYANRMMTYEQNIESIINRKDIKVDNVSYSLKDIFMAPVSTVKTMATDTVNYILDPLEIRLSPEEKAVFHQKYGMSYGNYMRINQLKEMLQKKSAEVVGYSGNLQKNLAEDRERLDSITGTMKDNESMVKQQQVNNAVMTIMAQDVKTQASLLSEIASQLATVTVQAQAEKQARQDELNINSLGIADGFMKMLEDMPSADEYR